jgi:hypothetical protein
VTVVAGNRGYDDPSRRFARRETWNGIKIIRIRSLTLGKQKRWHRAANFASFLASCAFRLLLSPRFDVVVALTSPPLISFLGALFVRVKGGKFFSWVMDLNPDEAIAAGWLKDDTTTARLLGSLLRYSLTHAEKIIALDHFMKRRIVEKGIADAQVEVLAPWAHDTAVRFDPAGRAAFRERHNLAHSFVVMYAGNHSPCHPLDTLMEAARVLADGKPGQAEIVFCFVGGGSELRKVKQFASRHELANIRCLPYQDFEGLSASLSAADLHVVVMGNEFVGIVHPSKIYNILTIGSPFLYIGPKDSHITELAAQASEPRAYLTAHGEVQKVVNSIQTEAAYGLNRSRSMHNEIATSYSRTVLMPRLINILESRIAAQSQVSGPSERARYTSVTG